MSIHFITYGDDNFKKSRERICNEAENTKWFSNIKYYTNILLIYKPIAYCLFPY